MRNKHLHERIRIQEPQPAIDLGEFLETNDLHIDIEPYLGGTYRARFYNCDLREYKGDQFLMGASNAGLTPSAAITELLIYCKGKLLIYASTSNVDRREILVPHLKNNFTPAEEKQVTP